MQRLIPFLLLVTVFLPRTLRGDDAKKAELKKFTGTWQCVKAESGGKDAPEEFVKIFKISFEGDKMSIHRPDKKIQFSFTIDPTKTPKRFTMTALEGNFKDKPGNGIYAWEGDKLKLLVPNKPNADTPFPETFDTTKDDNMILFVMKKAEK